MSSETESEQGPREEWKARSVPKESAMDPSRDDDGPDSSLVTFLLLQRSESEEEKNARAIVRLHEADPELAHAAMAQIQMKAAKDHEMAAKLFEAEREDAQRHYRLASRGQLFGFLLGFGSLMTGLILGLNDAATEGAFIAVAGMVVIAVVHYVAGRVEFTAEADNLNLSLRTRSNSDE